MSPSKAFFFSVTVFLSLAFLFDSLLEFLSLSSHYASVLAYTPLCPLEPLHINHGFKKFLVWSFQHSSHIFLWFWCLFSFFRCTFCLLVSLVIFWWKADMIYQIKGAAMNRFW
jgi:hypothetical protein